MCPATHSTPVAVLAVSCCFLGPASASLPFPNLSLDSRKAPQRSTSATIGLSSSCASESATISSRQPITQKPETRSFPMQPSPGVALREPGSGNGSGNSRQVFDPCCLPQAPLEQRTRLAQPSERGAVEPGARHVEGCSPRAGLPLFSAPGPQSLKGTANMGPSMPCKLPLPFPTQPLPAGTQQQQSSLAATFSKLSSQLEAQLGGRLAGERDDYLMRLLRRGQQGGAQHSGTAQLSSQQPAFTLQFASEAPSAFTHTARQLPQQQVITALPQTSAGAGQQDDNGSPQAKHSPEEEGTPSPKEQQLSPPAHATHIRQAGHHQRRGLGPDFAVTSVVLGQEKARKLRAIILRQQVAFTEQLYELHRAAAVQRLLMRNCSPQQARQLRDCRRTVRAAALAQPAPQDQPQRNGSGDSGSGAGSGSVPAPTQFHKPAAFVRDLQRPVGGPAHRKSMPLPNAEEQSTAQEQQCEQRPSPTEGPASALPPHLQPPPVGFGAGASAMPADPMAWWYRTHYGAGPTGQQVPAPGFPASSLTPRTAAVAAVAAAPALWQQHKMSWPLGSAASGGAAGNGAPSGRPAKWWQDPQATFGPPGDPEVVARGQPTLRGQEVESAPPRSHAGDGGAPDVRGSGRKRKGMEAAEEASSETTGRDAVHGVGAQQGIGAVASVGGSGKDSAFFQKLPVRPKATRLLPPPATKDGSQPRGRVGAATPEVEGHRMEEHAAQMLLSFSSRHM